MQQSQHPTSLPINTMAIVSLVLGIITWFVLPLFGGIVAIVTGHLAYNEIKNNQGRQRGKELAIAGLILGYSHVILGICGIIGLISFFGLAFFPVCGSMLGEMSISSIAIPPLPLN